MADFRDRARIIHGLSDAVPAGGDGDFFDRQVELRTLLRRLSAPPLCVTVVAGPSDCGKTKLLTRLTQIWLSDEQLAATSPVFYFDLREQVWSTPQDAAVHVKRRFRGWVDQFTQWARKVKQGAAAFTFGSVGVDTALKAVSDFLLPVLGEDSGSDLAHVMAAFCGAVDSNELTYPIFVLDEADRLKNWDKKDLVTFAGFFKSMVKQNNRGYLILSTSDDYFRFWLRDMFNPGQWEVFGVGWLPEADAHKFFTGHSLPAAGEGLPASFQDSDWNDVYAVCGGSPLLLNRCARAMTLNSMTWKEAADALMRASLCLVQDGLAATDADSGFSGDKYGKICTQIVHAGFACLSWVLVSIYDNHKALCKKEVKAMVLGGFIHLRFVSGKGYRDVTLADAGSEVELIMAPSPADRAAMKVALGL